VQVAIFRKRLSGNPNADAVKSNASVASQTNDDQNRELEEKTRNEWSLKPGDIAAMKSSQTPRQLVQMSVVYGNQALNSSNDEDSPNEDEDNTSKASKTSAKSKNFKLNDFI